MDKLALLSEDDEQIRFSAWLTKNNIRHSHSPNGGRRNLFEAMKFKRMGVSPGFPDVFIPMPTAQYHGLFIELKKSKGGKLSHNQVDWLNYLRGQGYYAEVAHGFEEAKEMVIKYLAIAPIA